MLKRCFLKNKKKKEPIEIEHERVYSFIVLKFIKNNKNKNEKKISFSSSSTLLIFTS